MKALVGAFNQEKALVGAFSVIVQPVVEPMDRFTALIQEWSLMLFLACPIMKGLNNLIWSGLFINDLSMHDYSRDIMLANAQQDMEAGLQKMQLNKKIALTKVISFQ